MTTIDNTLGSIRTIGNTVSGGLNTVKRLGADLGLGGVGGKATFWKDTLRQASFRGIPFGVFSSEGRFGRRNAIHEYPYKDSVWVEDMGRAARRIGMTGFLVENGVATPGDVISQRNRMINAAEKSGSATLIHPTLGEMDISLIDFDWRERWDLGRVVELTFHFIESGAKTFPEVKASTTDAVNAAADAADAAAGADFLTKAGSMLKSGISAVQQVVNTVQKYTRIAQNLINGATNLFHLVQTLTGQFGRFFGLSKTGTSSIPVLVAKSAVSRQNVANSIAAANVSALALSASTASSHPAAIQAVTSAFLAGSPNPRDAISSFQTMAESLSGGSGITAASNDLARRAAVVAMARAGALYEPTSHNDSVAIRSIIADQLAAEILIAADQGEDSTFQSLRELRAKSIQDLTERGGTLADLVTVTTPNSVPSLVLAQRLYGDISRNDELISVASPIHPLFMPKTFKALSS